MLRKAKLQSPQTAVDKQQDTANSLVENMTTFGVAVARDELPKFAYSELQIGRVIGKGGFSVVSEINGIKLDDVYDTSDEETKLRKDFTLKCRGQSPNNRFVVKTLRTDLPDEEHTKGVVDLAIEAEFLSHLAHPNIITMRATANSDPYESKYFVLLDRLVITLERKMNFWRTEVHQNMGVWMGPCGYCCAKKHILHRLWMERLMVARDIAKAIEYLHAQGICYRDLKPDNVGFDNSGEVKLFDFGLAKRIDPEDKVDNGLYHLTGNTGSLRYMAPEVALCEPYNLKVDAYSFGILFWQMCALTTPYLGYSTKMHADRVIREGYRPKPDKSWPRTWSHLMKTCWSSDISKRPEFAYIVRVLDDEVADLLRDEGAGMGSIKAKKKTKKAAPDSTRLDVDTRISTPVSGPGVRNTEANIV